MKSSTPWPDVPDIAQPAAGTLRISNCSARLLNAESFLGVPLWNSSRRVIGHLILVDDRPMSEIPSGCPSCRLLRRGRVSNWNASKPKRKLRAALAEVETLKNRLQAENAYLQEEIRTEHNFDEMVGQGRALVAVLRKVERIADTDATVVTGETGTGKELIARALHSRSGRKHRPLVKVNCGAVPAESDRKRTVRPCERCVHRCHRPSRGTVRAGGRRDAVPRRSQRVDPSTPRSSCCGCFRSRNSSRLAAARRFESTSAIIAATNRDLDGRSSSGSLPVRPLLPVDRRPADRATAAGAAGGHSPAVTSFVSRFAKKFGRRSTACRATRWTC